MKLTNRIYSLLVLLLVGSTSLWAQDNDPFGNVNEHKYQGSMTITAQVQQNGNVITDAIVAVYCKDELRGKKRVGAGTNPNLAYLTVYGEYTGYDDYLLFKVYTNGQTFICNPNPAITFTYNGSTGTELEPYVIDITPVSLANNADNSSVLTAHKGQTIDIVLTGRTLFKDGDWNTLCLPFDVVLEGSPLEGTTVKTLESTTFTNGMLTMNFSDDLTNIEAGKPYIVKWTTPAADIENPIFTGVTISNATANVSTDYVDFIGTYSPTLIYEEGDKHNLYLGSGNNIYYPTREGYKVNACRAYFQLKNGLTAGDTTDPSANLRAFVLNLGEGEETAIRTLSVDHNNSVHGTGWYTTSGVRLQGKPTQRGIYIRSTSGRLQGKNNGRKVVIK